MYQLYRDRPLLVFAIIIANCLLSAWCIYFDPVINNDGVTYLAMAQYMAEGDWQSAYDYYSWPYYALFIALTSKLFFVDIENAAYLLNTLFLISLTLAFVSLVSELSGNNRRIVFIAALVILLFPSINKYRSFIIRDFGYLSCYLWSLYFIFRFCSTLNKNHLIGWLLFAALSCLFRFEGIVFLLIAPYFLLLFSSTKIPHRQTILVSLSVLIVILSSALVFWYVDDKYASMIKMAKHTGEDVHGLADLFLANIRDRLADQEASAWNYTVVILSNIGMVFYELIRRMAVLYFFFTVYAYVKRLTLGGALFKKIWLVYVFTNLVVLIVFSLYNNFLVSRYTLATALTLLLLAPFAMDYFIDRAKAGGTLAKGSALFIGLLLVLISLDRLNLSTDKMYLKSAGQWLAENAAPEAKIYSNNKLVIYYADRGAGANLDELYTLDRLVDLFKTWQLRHYDYVAFDADVSNHSENTIRQTLAYHLGPPVHIEGTPEDHQVFVYDIKSRRQRR